MNLRDVDTKFIDQVWRKNTAATLGADPEFFVGDSKGKILASDKFFPGKEKPIKFKGLNSQTTGGSELKLFFDGIQAEINIGVQYCREYLAWNVRECLKKARTRIHKVCGTHQIILKPSVRVSKKVIAEADPEARRFGCMPDFNAYTLTTNTGEIDATKHPYRYAGGHIHLGVSSAYVNKTSSEGKIAKTEEGHIRIIKLLDLIVGIPCVLLDNSREAVRRRSSYGKAGCFRPTPYGIEYRTPSCWWIKSPMTVSLILGLARLAWTVASNNADERLFELIGYKPEDIRGMSDESNRKKALEVWERLMPHIALISGPNKNPIHIKAVRTRDGTGLSNSYKVKFGVSPQECLYNKNRNQPVVFSLPALEYLIKNGLDSLISDSIEKEWVLNSTCWESYRGFQNESSRRLGKNKDYLNFQTSFLKAIA